MRVRVLLMVTAALTGACACAEIGYQQGFEDEAAEELFTHSWGDEPVEILANGVAPGIGIDGSPAVHLKLRFPKESAEGQSYWRYDLDEPFPLTEELETISFAVKSTTPVRLKIGISPFGFIYHGPQSKGTGEWETVTLQSAFEKLRDWCARTDKPASQAWVRRIIFSVVRTDDPTADVVIDDLKFAGPQLTRQTLEAERFERRVRRVRVSAITEEWSDDGRTIEAVERLLDEAGHDDADLALLPMECVKTDGEPIPGPISERIAAKAAEHSMYVVGCIREADEEKTYVTSFLCDRSGEIMGKYRKSHRMPDEDMDLGDELPVFETDFGTIAMRIGSDRHFRDIDHVFATKGARLVLWSQKPEPVEDEWLQDAPVLGRAIDYRLLYACARYCRAGEGWISNKFPPYRGQPIGRSWVVNREGQRVACTPRKGAGVATAVIPATQLLGSGRRGSDKEAFSTITQPVTLPEPREWAKREVRLTAIQNHVGFDRLVELLNEAGQMGTDLAVTYEFVWIPIRGGSEDDAERVAKSEAAAAERLEQIAQIADTWDMYVLVAGVVEDQAINEGIVFDRNGEEAGRYRKIFCTYDLQQGGTETNLIETDFGRIGIHICADEAYPEIDHCYGIKGADIICVPTQSWGPDALHRDMRDLARTMDAGAFLVEATHSCSEARHRSIIADPAGAIVASSPYMRGGLVTAVVDLDNDRPRRYIREWTPHEPKGYLPQYQPDRFPAVANDLQQTIRAQRRPELYEVPAPGEDEQ